MFKRFFLKRIDPMVNWAGPMAQPTGSDRVGLVKLGKTRPLARSSLSHTRTRPPPSSLATTRLRRAAIFSSPPPALSSAGVMGLLLACTSSTRPPCSICSPWPWSLAHYPGNLAVIGRFDSRRPHLVLTSAGVAPPSTSPSTDAATTLPSPAMRAVT
jgi:hypothetical protein